MERKAICRASGRFCSMPVTFHPFPAIRRLFRWCGIAPVMAAAIGQAAAQEGEPRPMYIRQYRVKGAKTLSAAEVQGAVYPYLGPGRLPADVDQARAALEKAYHDKGLKAVSVFIPE